MAANQQAAGWVKAFADGLQRRVEKASHVDAAKAFAQSAAKVSSIRIRRSSEGASK
jgi:hypothetical protein